MPEPVGFSVDHDDGREAVFDCNHGQLVAFDTGPVWTVDQLHEFATRTLSQRTHCTCWLEQRVWAPPPIPDHVKVTELRVHPQEARDTILDAIEHERPRRIPPPTISRAAHRVFESGTPDEDHSLDVDLRLVRWWYIHGVEDGGP